MIAPEPRRTIWHAEYDCLSGRHTGCTLEDVPAAGHLGVIEERCLDALHEKATEDGRPCPTCRAAV